MQPQPQISSIQSHPIDQTSQPAGCTQSQGAGGRQLCVNLKIPSLGSSVLVAQLCLILCDPMIYSPPSSSVHGIFQARILEWVAIPFSRESSLPRDRTLVSALQADSFTPEPQGKPIVSISGKQRMNIRIQIADTERTFCGFSVLIILKDSICDAAFST